ncbi:di/tricarboxylate transporter [Rhodococcus opacus]|nr:SLC13 family permease [Rhodococcus opacus]MDH6292475.1 di/tricarboxylate transporter [Rhodococcus opacus]
MWIDALGVAALVVTFVLGTVTRVNMGALAFVAAFALGLIVVGESLPDVLLGFPTSFFLLIFGVTYLFSVAGSNGTTDWMVRGLARAVRGRAVVVPWTLFVVGAAVVSLGGPGQAVAGIVAPIGLGLAARFGISPILPAIMIVAGICAGAFSPISILGIVANEQAVRSGLPSMPIGLYLVTISFGIGVAAVAFVLFGGLQLRRSPLRADERSSKSRDLTEGFGPPSRTVDNATAVRIDTGGSDATAKSVIPDSEFGSTKVADPPAPGPAPAGGLVTHVATLTVVLTVAVGALAFGADIGVLAICGAVLLHLIAPGPNPTQQINWDVLLLICGVLTLIEVLKRAGTVDRLGEAVGTIGSPAIGVLVVCAVAALISAFASSTATLGILVPIAATLVPVGGLAPLAVVSAVGLSATLVDASPLSSAGALVVAGAPVQMQRKLFRALLVWALAMVVAVPVATFAFLILPSS